MRKFIHTPPHREPVKVLNQDDFLYSEGGYFESITYSVWSNFGGMPIPGAHYTIEFEDGYVSGVSKY